MCVWLVVCFKSPISMDMGLFYCGVLQFLVSMILLQKHVLYDPIVQKSRH